MERFGVVSWMSPDPSAVMVLDTPVATLDRVVEMRTQAALGGEVQGGPHSIATRSSRVRRL